MQFISWLLYPIYSLFLLSALLLVLLGGSVLFPPDWGHSLHEAAQLEIKRRFLHRPPLTLKESHAIDRLLGSPPEKQTNSADSFQFTLDAVMVLTGSNKQESITRELLQGQETLKKLALRRQVDMVSNVENIHLASYLWTLCRYFNQVYFVLRSFLWFFPRAQPFLLARLKDGVEKYSLTAIVLGLLGLGIMNAGQENRASSWLNFIGSIMTILALTGVAHATLKLHEAVYVRQFGPINTWSAGEKILRFAIFCLSLILILLFLTGHLQQWFTSLEIWLQSQRLTHSLPRWLQAVLTACITGIFLIQGFRVSSNRFLALSERIAVFIITPYFVLLLVHLLLFVQSDTSSIPSWAYITTVAVSFVATIAYCITWCIERWREYSLLRHKGISVPRKGFRWWTTLLWLSSSVLLPLSEALVRTLNSRNALIGEPLFYESLLALAAMLWALSAFPILTISYLFVRRIGKEYRKYEFRSAPAHPLLSRHHLIEASS